MNPNRNVILYGSPTTPAEKISLHAGPTSLVFDNGDLRTIRLGNQEIVRRIYVAVRGAVWDTIPLTLSEVEITAGADSFSIRFRAQHVCPPLDFSWQGSITGDTSGKILFTIDGQANTTFLRNRIGFCVLHPIAECAGKPCEIETVDGKVIQGVFPAWISPHQPFKNLRAIRHAVLPGVAAEVRMQGDIFEMEDQRNWADASYKTYSTPLDLPRPVEIISGTRITQSIEISLNGIVSKEGFEKIPPTDRVTVAEARVDQTRRLRLPEVGLCASDRAVPLHPNEIKHLRELNLSHLRIETHLADPAYLERLTRALAEANALDLPVELAVFYSPDSSHDPADLPHALLAARSRLARLLVFDEREPTTPEVWVDAGRRLVDRLGSPIPVGGGSRVYFTELNRFPPAFDRLDIVSYSINTQVHADDHASQLENTAGVGETVRSARHLSGGKPLAVGPVTLRPRFNPHVSGIQLALPPGQLPNAVDPRQASLLGALWTLGCLQSLVESQADSATFFETTGWKGVLAGEAGSPLPELFPHLPGMVFPLYHVLAGLGEFRDAFALESRSTGTNPVFSLALRKPGKLRLLLGNGCDQTQDIRVVGVSGAAALRRLDEQTDLDAMRAPLEYWQKTGQELVIPPTGAVLTLPPYAIFILDFQL